MITRGNAYDEARVAILLDDLAARTRAQAAAIEFGCESCCSSSVAGDATRAGVLRLGVDIARASQNSSNVWIGRDGSVNTNVHPVHTVIGLDIVASIEPMQVARDRKSKVWPWDLVWVGMFCAAIFSLAAIGFVTVLGWLRTVLT